MSHDANAVASVRAVILGAGRAARLLPLSFDRAKPFMTVGGVSLVEVTARLLAKAGFRRASLVVPDLEGIPSGAMDRIKRVGIELEPWCRPPGPSGSVTSVAQTLGDGEQSVLVVYGDSLLQADFGELLARHRTAVQRGGRATMLLHRPMDLRQPDSGGRTYHGVVSIDDAATIRRFVEKPLVGEIAPESWANAAVFVCERDIVVEADERGALDFSRDVFEPLVVEQGGALHGCVIGAGYRLDIGSVERLFDANMQCLSGALAMEGLPPECAIGLRARDGTAPTVWRAPLIMGSAVHVAADAELGPRVVVGDRCRIGARAVIRDSVILDDCEVGPGARVEGAILGAGTRLGPGTEVSAGSVTGPLTRLGLTAGSE